VSCFLGIVLQALTINMIAVLFVPLKDIYNFEYSVLGILVAASFGIQVLSDILCASLVDKLGYKKMVVTASIFAIIGICIFTFTPQIFRQNILMGFIIATLLMSLCGGIIEVVIGPLSGDLPSKNNDTFLCLIHSGYAWGQVVIVAITTISLYIIGYDNWQWIIGFWVIVPIFCLFTFFIAKYPTKLTRSKLMRRSKLIKNKYYIICLFLLFFCGATEVIMNQWASTFMEKSLHISKVVGDILGMCGFTVMLGLGRTLYGLFGEKLKLINLLCKLTFFAFICYLAVALSPFVYINLVACAISGFFISILWPGCLAVGYRRFPTGGAFLFGVLAMFGDIGGSIGPFITGKVVDYSANSNYINDFATYYNITIEQASIRIGILISAIFPLCAFIVSLILNHEKNKFSCIPDKTCLF
jgi:MFS family permease